MPEVISGVETMALKKKKDANLIIWELRVYELEPFKETI